MFWKIIFRLLEKRTNLDAFKLEVLSKESAAATGDCEMLSVREGLKRC